MASCTNHVCPRKGVDAPGNYPDVNDCPDAEGSLRHPVWMVRLDCNTNLAVKYPQGCTATDDSTEIWEIRTQSSEYCTWRWISSPEYQWPECFGKDKPSSWPDYQECPCVSSDESISQTDSSPEEPSSNQSFSEPEEDIRCWTEQWYDPVFDVWRRDNPKNLPMECKDRAKEGPDDELDKWIFDGEDLVGTCRWHWWGDPCEEVSETSSSSSSSYSPPPPSSSSSSSEPNPCAPQPSMYVSVSGHSSPVTWCGETWQVGESDTREVCPSTYNKIKKYLPADNATARHKWQASGLYLLRNYFADYSTGYGGLWWGTWLGNTNKLVLKATVSDEINFSMYTYGTWPIAGTLSKYIQISSLGMITGLDRAKYTDYNITDAFFGSHTIGGVTYTWSKGKGW